MPSILFLPGGWDGHQPHECCELFARLLAPQATCDIVQSLDILGDAARLRQYAAIVPCWTMGTLTGDQEATLCKAVDDGVGLAGWHGGMGDAFRSNTTYQFMVGGQFVAHPGNMTRYRVNITERQHPITIGLPDFDVASEQYYMHVDPTNHVLATTTFTNGGNEGKTWINACVMPVVWTRPWGRGRIAYSSIGHHLPDFDQPESRELTRRVILWAARLLA